MKKELFSKILIYALVTVCLMSFSVDTRTVQTYQPIETERRCSLRLTYHHGDKLFEGLEIQIFHAADVSENKEYTLSTAFRDLPVNINAVSSQSEWENIASTLTAYTLANSISPTQEKNTDQNGAVKFTDLPVGLYLVRWTKNETEDQVSGFEPFIISVPDINDDGSWNYDINALPKPGKYAPTNQETEYRAVVLWDDEGFEAHRPDHVQIEVFKDGKSVGIYTVSARENWTCKWTALDDGSVWTVVERGIGAEYEITVSQYGKVFTIVNHFSEETPRQDSRSSKPDLGDNSSPLRTGDDPAILIYTLVVLILSASLSVILIAYKRGESHD